MRLCQIATLRPSFAKAALHSALRRRAVVPSVARCWHPTCYRNGDLQTGLRQGERTSRQIADEAPQVRHGERRGGAGPSGM